jgi:hypothetical protein
MRALDAVKLPTVTRSTVNFAGKSPVISRPVEIKNRANLFDGGLMSIPLALLALVKGGALLGAVCAAPVLLILGVVVVKGIGLVKKVLPGGGGDKK